MKSRKQLENRKICKKNEPAGTKYVLTVPRDAISLSGLRLRTVLGVLPEERLAPREVEVDVCLALDLQTAGHTDNLADTVDYASLPERLRVVASNSSFQLLEALAEALVSELLRDVRILAVDLALRKPGAVPNANVEVRIHRARRL